MTGLYPEAHGIVGNTFYDPHLKDDFYYTDPSKNTEAKWWTAEPLWSTAEEQGVRSAVHMWPGSEAGIGKVPPTIVDGFNKSQVLGKKTERILQLLDLPGDDDDIVRGAGSEKGRRPNFIAAYVPNVDANGHKYGPNSTIVHDTIAKVDAMLGELFKGLEERNLTNVVNVVVVSDHGMATTSTSRLVQLEDLVDLSLVERIDGWPHRGLRPKKPVEENLKTLEKQLAAAYPKYKDRIEVYNKSTMPERYHFTRNDRIAPLWVFPKAGWAVVERPEFDAKEMVQTGKDYYPKGIHGYDNEHPLMRAIFIARGPKFSEKTNMASKGNTGGRRMAVFQNIEVYNIIAESLEVVPEPNNGTMKLPLKSVGWHEVPKPHESAQIFLPKNSTLETLPSTHASTSSTTTSMSAPKVKPPPATSSIQSTSTTQNTATPSAEPSVAPVDDDKSSPKDDQGFFAKVWNGFIEDVDAAKQWAGHVLHLDGEHEKDEGP
ncbi:ectonucleotide pyrophosphatase phosphodiesterase [Ascosphaera atra]|nr:ectonucleotide pyrophosphatase phosphodiesterase [Ascosphaera atra]